MFSSNNFCCVTIICCTIPVNSACKGCSIILVYHWYIHSWCMLILFIPVNQTISNNNNNYSNFCYCVTIYLLCTLLVNFYMQRLLSQRLLSIKILYVTDCAPTHDACACRFYFCQPNNMKQEDQELMFC
jgi:hypothetical protein